MEQYRNKQDKETANILLKYAKENGGPTSTKCFCKSSNITQYISTFWNWFDNK